MMLKFWKGVGASIFFLLLVGTTVFAFGLQFPDPEESEAPAPLTFGAPGANLVKTLAGTAAPAGAATDPADETPGDREDGFARRFRRVSRPPEVRHIRLPLSAFY